ASNVPLELPAAPQGDFETRELPLVTPGTAPQGGAVGLDAGGDAETLPTVDTTTAPAAPAADAALPATTAGGNFAVSFGSYATAADADRVIRALAAAQLPGFQESTPASGGRTLHRVRIGPFATQAEAEAARLQSAKVRGDVGAKVVTLDADDSTAPAAATASVSQPAPATGGPVSAAVPLGASTPATASAPLPQEPARPAPAKPEPATPAVARATTPPPAAKPVQKPAPAPVPTAARAPEPAASNVGFAVQLGAFGSAAEAGKLRDRARSAGFSAFVEQVRTDKGTLNRVRVGPVASRGEADQLKAQVASKLGVSGIVRPHP
ncbi:MAG TPA: SPOR domain-containing protein, partial [Lysobacter sp.]